MRLLRPASLIALGMVIGGIVAAQAAVLSGSKLFMKQGDFVTLVCSSDYKTADPSLVFAKNTSFNPSYAELRCVKK